MESFEQLLDQIDGFIRKYYKNQLLRGVLLFVSFFCLHFFLQLYLNLQYVLTR